MTRIARRRDPVRNSLGNPIRFVDLFCGIGGFHYAAQDAARAVGLGSECVFASDSDVACRRQYAANFGIEPVGDVREVDADRVPDHDLLLAGFPCQPFSILGDRGGFDDARGTLFFEIARILKAKRPPAFVLENVKQLRGHDRGRTLATILDTLRADLGYTVDWRVLNALDFGVPQLRERILIVGFREPAEFVWPACGPCAQSLADLLEKRPASRYFASERIRRERSQWHRPGPEPTIWHQNKSGHVSKYPYSCALRAGASHNYLLVDGERRLTEREMLRLQGFPDEFEIVGNYGQVRKQAGNAVPVPMAFAVVRAALEAQRIPTPQR